MNTHCDGGGWGDVKLLKAGCDPDAICIDVFTAHCPFDYLDRAERFHSKNETSANWGRGFQLYRQYCQRPDMVCVSEGGQDHLVGIADAGESDHIGAPQLIGRGEFADSERTPWHDIVTHGYYVLFAGGLGIRYQGGKGGNAKLHGYASDDYLSNCIIGGRNPMSDGPFSRNAVKTYWLQHDACAELGRAEFGAAGRMVAGVDAVDPEKGAVAPTWSQVGNFLKITCDAKAFAYRIRQRGFRGREGR